jgi:hypothetical protein
MHFNARSFRVMSSVAPLFIAVASRMFYTMASEAERGTGNGGLGIPFQSRCSFFFRIQRQGWPNSRFIVRTPAFVKVDQWLVDGVLSNLSHFATSYDLLVEG